MKQVYLETYKGSLIPVESVRQAVDPTRYVGTVKEDCDGYGKGEEVCYHKRVFVQKAGVREGKVYVQPFRLGSSSKKRLLIEHRVEGQHTVSWYKLKGGTYLVTYGQEEDPIDTDEEACITFGACIRHALECAGKLD